MTFVLKPKTHHPKLPLNDLGLTRRDYEGSVSTLCAGCGHDSVSAAIVQACSELSLPPHRFAKVSGIGCSSKTPSYFLNKSHGFNSVHGRMPSVMTGANLANKELYCVGVSGDGDSASIGLGQFAHIVRRRINMLYLVDNNACGNGSRVSSAVRNDTESTSVVTAILYLDICSTSRTKAVDQMACSFINRHDVIDFYFFSFKGFII